MLHQDTVPAVRDLSKYVLFQRAMLSSKSPEIHYDWPSLHDLNEEEQMGLIMDLCVSHETAEILTEGNENMDLGENMDLQEAVGIIQMEDADVRLKSLFL